MNNLQLLRSSGLADRFKGLYLSAVQKDTDSSVINEIRKLRASDKILLGTREGDLAQAIDFKLTGATHSGTDGIKRLLQADFITD